MPPYLAHLKPGLRAEAEKAARASDSIRMQHSQRSTRQPRVGKRGTLAALLGYLADRRPGDTPDAQLAALIITLRCARDGRGNLIGGDLTGLRPAEPADGILYRLIGTGWLHAQAEAVLAAQPETAEEVTVPDFDGTPAPVTVSRNNRARISGLTQRILSHKALKKQPAAARLLAVATVAHATAPVPPTSESPNGTAPLEATQAVRLCALNDPGELADPLDALIAAGWLTQWENTGPTMLLTPADPALAFIND